MYCWARRSTSPPAVGLLAWPMHVAEKVAHCLAGGLEDGDRLAGYR